MVKNPTKTDVMVAKTNEKTDVMVSKMDERVSLHLIRCIIEGEGAGREMESLGFPHTNEEKRKNA